jgi:hypothetical protein
MKVLALGVGLASVGLGLYAFTHRQRTEADDESTRFLNSVWRTRSLVLGGFGIALALVGVAKAVAALAH